MTAPRQAGGPEGVRGGLATARATGETTDPHRSVVLSRLPIIRELLERLVELSDPQQVRRGSGDGVAVPSMPETYSASVREVERLLGVMREDRWRPLVVVGGRRVSVRSLWWHVRGFYVDAERGVWVPPRVRVPRSRRGDLRRLAVDGSGRAMPVLRVVRVPGARRDLAEAGVEWIAREWGLSSEPQVFRHGRMGYALGCRCLDCKGSQRAVGERVAA